eukprot:5566943-Prymnesium_polylepis.1
MLGRVGRPRLRRSSPHGGSCRHARAHVHTQARKHTQPSTREHARAHVHTHTRAHVHTREHARKSTRASTHGAPWRGRVGDGHAVERDGVRAVAVVAAHAVLLRVLDLEDEAAVRGQVRATAEAVAHGDHLRG